MFDDSCQTALFVPRFFFTKFSSGSSVKNQLITAFTVVMTDMLPIKTAQLKLPDQDIIKEMIRIYQEAYKSDERVQLKYILPEYMENMAETIANRVKRATWEFIVATNESSTRILGWLALAFKLENEKQLSEEHVLFVQYALLPDIVVKGKSQGIGSDEMGKMARSLLKDFKDARERQLPDKHCILSTLVVDPKYQNRGIASALLTKAINRSEVCSFPIWVQAPEACQSLFTKHGFEEVDEYQLDLDKLTPEGKGKKKAVSIPGKHVWKFMVRKESLDREIEAYRSSKMFPADEAKRVEAERKAEETRLGKGKQPAYGKRMLGWISKAFAEGEAESGPTEPLLGIDERSAGKDRLAARRDAEVGPSTPLLTKTSSKRDQKKAQKEKVVGDVISGESVDAPIGAEAGPSTPLLTKSSSKGGQKKPAKEQVVGDVMMS